MSNIVYSKNNNYLHKFDALSLDAGGVLLRPNYKKIQNICGLEYRPTEVDIDKALYMHGIVGAGLGPGDSDDDFAFSFLIAAKIPEKIIKKHFKKLRDIIIFEPWIQRYPYQTYNSLEQIQKIVKHIIIVTNTEYGGAKKLLSSLNICQVGEGKGINVSAIIDSAEINIHKPDPKIYKYAIDFIGVQANKCLHIGDSVRNDVEAARDAGLEVMHFCPYSECKDNSHKHLRSLDELVENK